MSYLCILCICALLWQYNVAHYTQQWAVHITGGKERADEVARDHGFINLGEIFEDYYHFKLRGVSKRSLSPHHGRKARFAADTRVHWSEQQKAKRRVKRDIYSVQDSDPRWPSMWYLNRGNGLDMNVIPAWQEGITGQGAVVTILDDGLEKDHPDLMSNYDPMASYDVNNQDPDPTPRYDIIDSNRHGTRCAGEVAATSNNSVCALGVAHGASVGGVKMLDGDVTDAVEARSLSLNPQHIDIYSASWGPDDDGKTVDGPGELATRAFIEGITKGRGGKGSIFIWASGNGGRDHDNCNCDGYTNSIYSLSISSATEQGHVPWYSEACSSTLASTYSSGALGERQIVTTDLHHSCTSSHTGTSASAPLAAGICALALEANPKLTWRDMQHIVVRTARPQHLITPDWRTNGVGRNVSHSFGYGLMDAHAMVKLARQWVTVPEQHNCEITAPHVDKLIPARSTVVLQLPVTECKGVEVLEHVQAKLTIYSQRRGDLRILLKSPMGTQVTLLAYRTQDTARVGFTRWPFMSVHSWGETPFGTWQLEIHNDGRMLERATLQNWSLLLYGTKQFSIDVPNNLAPTAVPKIKSTKSNRNKNNKKTKFPAKSIKKNSLNATTTQRLSKPKQKNNITSKYAFPLNLNVNSNRPNKKKFQKNRLDATTLSPFYYSLTSPKLHITHNDNSKNLLKYKNIPKLPQVLEKYPDAEEIYPLLHSHDTLEMREQSKKSNSQKQKEKSRDLNSNRNIFKNTPELTTVRDVSTTTKDLKTAKLLNWELSLHGTETHPIEPGMDHGAQTTKAEKTHESSAHEFEHNSIETDTPPSTWQVDPQIHYRENPLKFEIDPDPDVTFAASKCARFNDKMCIECMRDYILHGDKCLDQCPEKFYEFGIRARVCSPCHYTCQRCKGPMDYSCTQCFPDEQLTNISSLESYCYPKSLIVNMNITAWYKRVYILLWVIIFLLVVTLVWFAIYKYKTFYKKSEFVQLTNSFENIRDIEYHVKNTVYSDSD